MKNTIRNVAVFSLAALALSTTVFAQEKKDSKAKTEVACAIMKDHKVNIKKATADNQYADYKGRRYFFCCAGCKPAFEKAPAKYAKSDSIPTPKETKKPKKG